MLRHHQRLDLLGLLAENLLIGLDELLPGIPTSDTASLVTRAALHDAAGRDQPAGRWGEREVNVVLTLVEMTALAIVIGIGFYAVPAETATLSRVTVFESPDDKGLFMAVTIATAIAFFSMVGFEDSVNMVEEVKDPLRIFPR